MKNHEQDLIPSYGLYGEENDHLELEFIHCEPIVYRCRMHDWVIKPHSHDELFQIIFIESGMGRMSLEGRENELSAPCFITIPPTMVHGFTINKETTGRVITVAQSWLERILAPSPRIIASLDNAHLVQYRRDCAQHCADSQANRS